jgi:alpha-L-arabinofuranosidase
LEERYNLADALAVATFLNVFVRQCAVVRMANLAQLVNVIAPIVTSPQGLFRQTIFHPFRLASAGTRPAAPSWPTRSTARPSTPPTARITPRR